MVPSRSPAPGRDDVVVAYSPGRVNLIGDHTDYTGGLVLPMAIDLGTTVVGRRTGATIDLVSDAVAEPARLPLRIDQPQGIEPEWARYVAGVVAESTPEVGFVGVVESTVPIGAGLSSSASLSLAVALALGFEGTPLELAQLCQRSEQRASGVPVGIMDQLVCASALEGRALLIDCTSLRTAPVALPDGVRVLAVHCGVERRLAGSEYADRRADCETAARIVGPLAEAGLDDLAAIDDRRVRRRARHVMTENQRVRDAVVAIESDRLDDLGEALNQSHRSLAGDFEVSIPEMDALVARLRAHPGVFGARMTGGGFGGCAVALVEADGDYDALGGWLFRPCGPATLVANGSA